MMRKQFLLGALSALFIALPFSLESSLVYAQHKQALIAEQITPANASQRVRQGQDAIGGINDWFISNGTLCAIVSDVSHEGEFSPRGGSLVDLGYCGRADDYFTATYDLLQGSQQKPMLAERIRAEVATDSARIIVQSTRHGAVLETIYSLNIQQAEQLHIHKRLTTDGSEDFNFVTTVNFNLRSLEPFVLNSQHLEHSNGFQQEDFVGRGLSAIDDAARHADTLITISPPDAIQGIAYGWQIASAKKISDEQSTNLPTYLLADDWSNASLVLADDFLFGGHEKIGWLQLAQIPFLELDSNQEIQTHEIIYVGDKGNVSTITDQLFTNDSVVVKGQINEINSAIHFELASGVPITHLRPDANGKFELVLPNGEYVAKAKALAGREQALKFNTNAVQNLNFELPPAGKLTLPQGQAMRLVFIGLDGTNNPSFNDTLTGYSVRDDDGEQVKEAVNQVFLAGVAGDKTEVDLVSGKYQVYATRGPEYSLEKTQIDIKAGETQALKIDLPEHINPTPGYIAADLHVHSGFSFDNAFGERERVRTFVAEHGEVMVASEHDVAVDYRPIVKAMGLLDKVIPMSGTEATSLLPTELNPYTNGHANFFPFDRTPYAYRGGVLAHEDRRWREVLAHLRQAHPEALAQINHPRRNLALSGETLPSDWQEIADNGQFLDHMGSAAHPFNPHKPLTSAPNNTLIEADPKTGMRDIDFDLIEVVNPGHNYMERTQAVRLDWLSLLKQGERLVATANSDSHHAREQVAVPRNMVAVKGDQIASFDQAEFLAALKIGNSYGTTGPMLELKLGEQPMGGLFQGQRGNLWVKITKTPWVNVTHIDIQIDGETVDSHPLNDQNQQEVLVPLNFSKDAFVTVEVHGETNEDYTAVYPDLVPYAFSNPVFVDFDGDGQWTAPGL